MMAATELKSQGEKKDRHTGEGMPIPVASATATRQRQRVRNALPTQLDSTQLDRHEQSRITALHQQGDVVAAAFHDTLEVIDRSDRLTICR